MRKSMIAVALITMVVMAMTLGSCRRRHAHIPAVASTYADVPGWTLNADKPIRFDWYVHFGWFARQWGNCRVSRYITEKTGVDIRFIVPAGGLEEERLNTMIAGNALPDFITLGWWQGQIPMMIEAGMLYPLDYLAELYDPFFFSVANPERLAWYTQADGHVYGYPNASFTARDVEQLAGRLTSNQTFLVRRDMWEAIGSPDMSTPEGFLGALRAARETFPTVGGQPLIPLTFGEFGATGNHTLQSYLLNFLAIPPETEDGRFYDPDLGPNHPCYVMWLRTFRQAASEGLIPMSVFVHNRSQIEEIAAQGRFFAMLYQNWDMQAAQHARFAADPNSIYIAIDGPRNSRGDAHTLSSGGISGWTLTLISRNVRDRARAIQFMSYLMSEEGQMALFFGVPEDNPFGMDPTFSMVDGVPTLLPYIAEMDRFDKNRQEIEIGVQYTYWMLMNNPWTYRFPQDMSPALEQPQLWTRPFVTSFALYDRLDMEPGSPYALIYDNIARRWGTDLPRLILANTNDEFDRIWNDFQAFKTAQGFERLQARQTELLDRNRAAMQLAAQY
ncbi:MAG: extracellular solute-binding protein [Treponema sp.]|nr:extracellular solute-binding protein [Treponema sp.]